MAGGLLRPRDHGGSLAKQTNRRLRRTGQVFADRFAGRFDPYSTAHQFAGWREEPARIVDLRREATLPTKFPTTWLLEHGWKRLPLASAVDVPGPGYGQPNQSKSGPGHPP